MLVRTRRSIAPLAGLLLLIAALAVAGCSLSDGDASGGDGEAVEADGSAGSTDEEGEEGADGEEGEDGGDEAVPVEIVELERGHIEAVLRFSTHLEAESEVQVFSQAARQVRQLVVEEGDEVRRGDVLLRLQDDEQRTALARVESQLAKAEREYQRQQSLYAQKLISEQAFNDATYELEQLELALADARRELSYTEVRAPIGGTITARHVNLGDQVTINQLLFDIIDFDSIVARVYVPEKELPRVRVGQGSRISADALPGVERDGAVERILPRIDPKSGTFKVTVSVPRSAELLPGMYVSVELVTEVNEDAVRLPKRALVHDGDDRYVFRVRDDGTVERLRVEARLEDRVAIEPAGGFDAGDRVVVAGQAGLKDGTEVRIIERPPPASSEEEAATS